MFLIAVITAMVALVVVSQAPGRLTFALLGAVALVATSAAVIYTTLHPDWLILPLLLIEVLTAAIFVPKDAQSALHYLLEFAFCIPVLPLFWRSRIFMQGDFKLLSYYFCWALITVVFSLAPFVSFARWVNSALAVAAICVCTQQVETKEDVAKLVRNYLIGCSIIVTMMVAARLLLPSSLTMASPDADALALATGVSHAISGDIPRFAGILTSPNQVGALALVTIGAALVYWDWTESKRVRAYLAILVLAAVGLLWAADSRSAMVAATVGAVLYFIWKYRWRGIVVSALAAVVIAVAASLFVRDLSEHLSRGELTTLTGRTDIWRFSINQIGQRPLFGWGYEVEGQIYQSKYFPIWWGPWDEGPHSSLHNNYISHMIGVGIPATILWLFVMVRPWVRLFRRKTDPWNLKPVALLVTIPILILNLSESSAGDASYSVGLLFLLVWALAERNLHKTEELKRVAEEYARAETPPLVQAIVSGSHAR